MALTNVRVMVFGRVMALPTVTAQAPACIAWAAWTGVE